MAPKTRPRPHATLDRDFLAQDTVRDLGEQFGPVGPLVLLALICAAGKVTSASTPGIVDLRYTGVARETFTKPDIVRAIVRELVPLGLLTELEEGSRRFRGRMVKFDRWESVPMTDAERKARQRAREGEEAAAK